VLARALRLAGAALLLLTGWYQLMMLVLVLVLAKLRLKAWCIIMQPLQPGV
jgi:hypothetical protein